MQVVEGKAQRSKCVPKLGRVFLVEFFAPKKLKLLKVVRIGQSPFLQKVVLVCSMLQILYSTITIIIIIIIIIIS